MDGLIKRITASALLAISFLSPSLTNAQENNQSSENFPTGIYLTTGWGLGKVGDLDFGTDSGTYIGTLRHNPGLEYDLGIGYDFGKRYRLDVTYGQTGQNYENSSTPSGYVDTIISTLSLNGYIDFPTETNLTPFIGLGIGSARVDVQGGWATAATASLKVGAAYALTERLELEGKLTLRGLGRLDYTWVEVTGAKNTSGLLGLRFKL